MSIDFRCPGLAKRVNGATSVYYWICRSDVSKKGYPVKSARLWSGPLELSPTPDEMILIRNECFRLTSEMKDWMRHPGRRDSRKMRAPGSIYFIGDGKRVKIGFAQHLAKRQSQLQTSSSRPLTLLGSIPGNRHVEQFLHWQFRKSRRQGEWFQLTGDLRSFIATHVTENASKTEIANVTQTSKRPIQNSVDLIDETPQEKHVLVQVV